MSASRLSLRIPAVQRFITEDEIAATLTRGSNIEGGKGRIYAYFKEKHTSKEQADFLKKEYGVGGSSHAVSGASHSGEDHSGKGIVLKKQDCPEIQLNWANVAKRISELIRKDRFLTPEEKARFEQLQRQTAERSAAWNDYNAVKKTHPDNIVLFQVGDFFEMYGEDAKQAAELLDLNLTTREIPGAGRVEMCGVPSHNLEMYVEKLRDKYDVTIAEAPDFRAERHIYTLRSIDHEAEAAINAYEAEFGADGTRVFRDPAAEQVQPTVQERLEHYRPVVMAAVSEDTAYRNACGHSDRENAEIECNAAVRRAVLNSKDMELIRLFSDVPEFRNHLHQEVFEGTYERLHDLLRPLSQDDIDDALRAWNGNIESKHAVVRYMQQHGREKETAAWLAHEYGGKEGKLDKSASFDTYLEYVIADGWTKLDGVDTVYYRVVDGTTNQIGTAYSVLKDDQVTVKGSVTKEQMNALDAEGAAKPTLTITAYASQLHKNATETFSASEAWNNIANK